MTNAPQKTEIPGIVKVGEGMLINTDNDSLKAYKSRKLREKKIDDLDKSMESMKNELSEIKELLKGLVK
jgi:prefoldin subunit 5